MNVLALAVLVAVAAAEDPGTLIGNGRVTAVVDEFGAVSVCRWPGPAMNNQLGGGAKWGIATEGNFNWLGPDACSARRNYMPGVSTSSLSFPDGTTATVQVHVALNEDVLVSRMTFNSKPPDLIWYADFSPSAVILPELAVLRDLAPRDFAAYVKDNRVYQFRPKAPGSKEWDAAAIADWETFAEAEGVWIVMASPQAVRASCGLAGSDISAAARLAQRAAGDCDSALFLRPQPAGDSHEAVVFAAFGATRAEAESALDHVINRDRDALLADVHACSAQFAEPPLATDAPDYPRRKKDLVTIALATDRSTGAFTRDPAGDGCSALCYTRDCAWASMAFDLAGREEEAGKILAFAASTARKEPRRGKPRGSLPMAVYGNGTEALPHLALDSDAPAFVLGAIWKHAAAIKDPNRRGEFLQTVWPDAQLMADFLAGWTDSRNREPLYTFDPAKHRDRQGPDRLLTTYMGIDAALRIAAAAGQPEPEDWARRKVELDALIRFQLVDRQTRAWKPGPVLPYWHDLIAQDWALKGPPLPSWDNAVQDLLKSASAEAAAAAALVWGNDPARAPEITAAIEKAHAAPPDHNALKAAQRIIADCGLRIPD